MPPVAPNANKRLAKNTLLLYIRMILLLAVSLYTSRIILAALGFDDYGIYNVVGGVVSMFAFINAAMGNASSRFITYALGKGDNEHSINVFNVSILVHALLAIIIVILAENIGLWFFYNKMIIPASRMTAAFWVYQLSIISCVATILCVPFNATIIAHEKMGAFAYISLLDAILKLGIAFAITVTSSDRLVLYALLYLGVNLLNIVIYQIYCFRKFETVKFQRPKNYAIMKEMMGFAGWSLIGNLATLCCIQGLNLLLNVFFGPVVNAARGIAYQIQGAVKGFITNFQMAINPQITKSYAAEDYKRLQQLIVFGSKFSFCLMLCIMLPISLEIKPILHIWLGKVPDYTAQFAILTMGVLLIDTLANPLGIANNATGKIRNYQIVEGGTLLLILPVAYIVLKMGGNPISVFWVQLVIMFFVQILRIFLVCHKIHMPKSKYVYQVLFRVLLVAGCSVVVPILVWYTLPQNLLSFIAVVITSIGSTLFCAYYLGLNSYEKANVSTKISSFTNKLKFR